MACSTFPVGPGDILQFVDVGKWLIIQRRGEIVESIRGDNGAYYRRVTPKTFVNRAKVDIGPNYVRVTSCGKTFNVYAVRTSRRGLRVV